MCAVYAGAGRKGEGSMIQTMKAISLWQPFSGLWVNGDKKIETRGWPTSLRGVIAVHSTQFHKLPHEVYMGIWLAMGHTENDYPGSFLYYQERACGSCSFGHVLGEVMIEDCVPIEKLYGSKWDTPMERAMGDWTPGRFGWITDYHVKYANPVPAKGKQGFWNWERPEGIMFVNRTKTGAEE
jgi:hypothetical protein